MLHAHRLDRRLDATRSAAVVLLLLLATASPAVAQGAAQTLFVAESPQRTGLTDGPGANYELGLRFFAGVSGRVTAIRFWKDASESGTHTGRLWTASGALLASVTFESETSSGWQEQALPAPVAISGGVVYVVSVNTGGAFYVATSAGLASQVVNGQLASVVGGNGVFGAPGEFPTGSWNSTNYFRDVVFVPDAPGRAVTGSLAPAASGAGAEILLRGPITLRATADAEGRFAFSGVADGTYTAVPEKRGFRFEPRSRTVVVSGADVGAVDFVAVPAYSLFEGDVPEASGLTDGRDYELGVRFTSSTATSVAALRYWKSPGETGTHIGRLWTESGTLLASVAFENETPSGWQEQDLPAPVPLVAGAVYVATVNTGGTLFAMTAGVLATPVVRGPIATAPGPNGVFGPAGSFPTETYAGASYFRDVVLVPDSGPRHTLAGALLPPERGAGARVALGGDAVLETTADAAGSYAFAGLPAGTYTVSARKPSYSFEPPVRAVDVTFGDVLGVDFAARLAQSIFTTEVPSFAGTDGIPYELGTRFAVDAEVAVTALRFWKAPEEAGTHVGRLWTESGTLIAEATFANESPQGWQEQRLASPVPLVPGVTYVVSVATSNGFYVATGGGLAAEVHSPPLRTIAGGNGVFGPLGECPTNTYNDTNYFRDVVVTEDTEPRFSIAGSVTPAGTGAGTSIRLSGFVDLETAADAAGGYSFDRLPAGSYTVTPFKPNHAFTPASATVSIAGDVVLPAFEAVALPPRDTLHTTQVPAGVGTEGAYELGLRFYSVVNGSVVAIRFYKAAGETGTHTGRLWDAEGRLLASTTFTGETASGWQEQALPVPVPIAAFTIYTVSVNTGGAYVATVGGLDQQIASGALRSVVGNNGVYGPPGSYPTSTYRGSDYFRDLVLVEDVSPRHAVRGSLSPAGLAAGATVRLNGGALVVTADASGAYVFDDVPDGTYTIAPSKAGIQFDPPSRTVTVSGADAVVPPFAAAELLVLETIFGSAVPAASGTDGPYELGLRFYSVENGSIAGIRFYKPPGETGTHVGRLWSATGDLLASVTFAGETASGWQEQSLPSPVPITAFTVYTVSVNSATAYAATFGGLATQVSSGSLRTVVGDNGVVGQAGQYPTSSFQNSNYFRDVMFAGPPLPSPNGFRIAGQIAPAASGSGAVIALTGASQATAVADTSGAFLFSGLADGSYTLTPSKRGFSFEPPSATVVVSGADAGSVSFVARAANAIVAENAKPGTSEWRLADPSYAQEIDGYASAVSVARGAPITFFVNSRGASYTLDIYRLGWYGGLGGTLVASAGVLPGRSQQIPAPDPITGLVECNWTPTYVLQTGAAWTSGMYVARIRRTDTGKDNHIWFIVRDDASTSDILYQWSSDTMQAYNNWGGMCLYSYLCDPIPVAESRDGAAVKVSFDRPYRNFDPSLNPSHMNHFLRWEYPMVRWLESQGYDVTYVANLDVHVGGADLLARHRLFLSSGHDEYWSSAMRDAVEEALRRGTNVAVFSSNAGYWQVRFEPSSSDVPDRVMVGYKASAEAFDPLVADPVLSTTRFRDQFVNRPENRLFGVMYADDINDFTAFPLVVTRSRHPFFRNTGIADGASFPSLVGYEWDNLTGTPIDDMPSGLTDVTVLSHSPTLSRGIPSHSNSCVRQTPSGALLFASGTNQWSFALDDFGTPVKVLDQRIRQTTANILLDLGASPATPSAAIVLTPSFSISGSTSPAVQGAMVTLSGAEGTRTTMTDAAGRFVFKVVGDGTYTITLSKAGTTFVPSSRSVTVSGGDVVVEAFEAR